MLDDALDAVDAVVGVVGEAVDVVDVVDDFPFAKKKFSQELLSKEFSQMSLVLARPSKRGVVQTVLQVLLSKGLLEIQ